jgi:guanylate kinase
MKKLFIVTGPSGTGKTTISNFLINKHQNLKKVITCTTRGKRSEDDQYRFLSKEEFVERINNEEFLEYEEVYPGTFYGTLKKDIQSVFDNKNYLPLIVLDVKGAFNIKSKMGDNCCVIYLKPPSMEVLEKRLISRGTDVNIEQRLEKAKFEILFEKDADLVINNQDFYDAYSKISEYINNNNMSNKYGDTLVVNLFAPPGSGKSTTAAGIFYLLKIKGLNCELVSEYAKDKTWEESFNVLNNQLYLLGKQHHRLFRLLNKVDVIITDSPLFMQQIYTKDNVLDDFIKYEFSKFNNLNFYINRVKPYNPKGRNQTENESDVLGGEIIRILQNDNIEYTTFDGDENCAGNIVKIILEKIKGGH